MLQTFDTLCLKCGACVSLCPTEALILLKTGITVEQELCTDCEDCVRFCAVAALEIADA
jgi:ferredoxin